MLLPLIIMFWRKDDTDKKLRQMNDVLKKSFANVKRDTHGIFQWLNYFYKRGMEQEQTIRRLQVELSYIPKTREEIRKIIDDYYSFENTMAKIRELSEKVDDLARKQAAHAAPVERHLPQPPAADMSHIEKRLEKLEQKKASMREKIMKRLTRNSKEYVKSVMMSYIKKYESVSALQLKDIIVDEQQFCSKSSFYRLLEELEDLDEIGVVKRGKEKHYITKAMKHLQS